MAGFWCKEARLGYSSLEHVLVSVVGSKSSWGGPYSHQDAADSLGKEDGVGFLLFLIVVVMMPYIQCATPLIPVVTQDETSFWWASFVSLL